MNDNEELISVIIPAYNRESTIVECIESVLAQTYKNIEIIVVDDCSSDKTADIVDSLKDDRVLKCIRLTENHGACYARNYGAEQSKGKYIAFQDSDDTWYPEKLEKQLKYLKKGNYDFVFCGMTRIYTDKEEYVPYKGFTEGKDAIKQVLYANPSSTQCMFMTRETFFKVKFDESIKRYQDWDFCIRVSQWAKMGYLKEALVYSAVQSDSITRKVSRYESLKIIYNKYKKIIDKTPYIKANFYKKFGDEFWHSDKKKAREFYIVSIRLRFNMKLFIKCVISIL